MIKKPHIIDIPINEGQEIYYVSNSFKDRNSTITVTPHFNEAVEIADKQPDSINVYNSKGIIMYTSNMKTKRKMYNIHTGLKFHADGINVYRDYNNTIPDSAYHGSLIVESNHMKSDKYKVKTDAEYPEILWCKARDIERYLPEE